MGRSASIAYVLIGLFWLVACGDGGGSASDLVQPNDSCQTAFVIDPPVTTDQAIAAIRASQATPTEIRFQRGKFGGAMGGQDPMEIDEIASGLEAGAQLGPEPIEILGLRFEGIVDPRALGELAAQVSYRKEVPSTSVLVYNLPDVAAESGDEQIIVVKAFNTCET